MSSYGNVVQPRVLGGATRVKRVRPYNKSATMTTPTLKQRIRNWLYGDEEKDQAISVREDALSSEGMRFQLYKANGGFVIETRKWDQRTGDSKNTMYVITEDKDIGEEIGKIITMESLR